MKKFKLQLEDLRIDSFATTPVEKARGGVLAEALPILPAVVAGGAGTGVAE